MTRTISIPHHRRADIAHVIRDSDSPAARRVLDAMRLGRLTEDALKFEISAEDAAWAFRYGTAEPIIGKLFASFEPPEPPTYNEVFNEVHVDGSCKP
jgi:hypothetical protein